MSASMKDNPLHQEGKSHRRKIIDYFEINLNRCILCGICVEVCNFDAIVMSHEHEMSTYERNGDRVDLQSLLKIGLKYQSETGWMPPSELAKQKKAAEGATKEKAGAAVGAEDGKAEEEAAAD
jgi:formate hydrogenlyase subunit 6/NADH:ubiquinone oxidoreductase subunit I